jgi:DNA polymerase III sliding clamp (beta) subunit (PCNA family)
MNKIIISTTSIKSLLADVVKVIPKSPDSPIMGYLLFEVVDRTLHITSTNLKTFFTASTTSFDCNRGASITGCTKATILEHINNLDDEPLTIEFCDDFSVKVSSSDDVAIFEGTNPIHFPRQSSPPGEKTIVSDTSLLNEISLQVQLMGNRNHPETQGAEFRHGSASFNLTSTNGFVLRSTDQRAEDLRPFRKFIVPEAACRLLAMFRSGKNQLASKLEISVEETEVWFFFASPKGHQIKIATKLLPLEFPDWRSKMPSIFDSSFAGETERLNKVLSRSKVFAKDNGGVVDLIVANGKIQFSSEGVNTYKAEAFGDSEGAETKMSFDPNVLASVTNLLSSKVFTVSFSPKRFARFTEGDSVMYVGSCKK